MSVEKRAKTNHPVCELIAKRWSPYTFDPRPVERDKLLSCLEAARWAASSYNEQPWSILVAERDDGAEFSRALDCLIGANQGWAKNAGVLLLTAVAKNFVRNDKPNGMSQHDLGLAVGNLTLQATELGLAVHQMAGIDPDKVRETYGVPTTHEPMTAIALGYVAADDQLGEREKSPRSRKSFDEFIFSGAWNQSAKF